MAPAHRGVDWSAASQGLALTLGSVGLISPHTVALLSALCVLHDAYLRPPLDLTAEDVAAADHVVAVKAGEHRPLLGSRFLERLRRVEFWDVHDVDCAVSDTTRPCLTWSGRSWTCWSGSPVRRPLGTRQRRRSPSVARN